MGWNTEIAWAHDTFNPWWGCTEVSPGCDHCYARTAAHRYGNAVWGKDADRRFFTDKHWELPYKWNRVAEKAGARRRVFCASMADILEERSDTMGVLMSQARDRLWMAIAATPQLDWLLLSKRATYRRVVPPEILKLPNVWPGVTVESRDYLWRAEALLELDCSGPSWVSYEPAIGPVTFSHRLDWIVVGGESGFLPPLGHDAPRAFDLEWARSVLAKCQEDGTAFFMKQIGARPVDSGTPVAKKRGKGDNPDDWPVELRVQEFPR